MVRMICEYGRAETEIADGSLVTARRTECGRGVKCGRGVECLSRTQHSEEQCSLARLAEFDAEEAAVGSPW